MEYVANVLRDGHFVLFDATVTLSTDRTETRAKPYRGRIAVPGPSSLHPGDHVELIVRNVGPVYVVITGRDGDTAVFFETDRLQYASGHT